MQDGDDGNEGAVVVMEMVVDWSGVDLRASNVTGPRLCYVSGTQRILGDPSSPFVDRSSEAFWVRLLRIMFNFLPGTLLRNNVLLL
jgi:hypothetical protein